MFPADKPLPAQLCLTWPNLGLRQVFTLPHHRGISPSRVHLRSAAEEGGEAEEERPSSGARHVNLPVCLTCFSPLCLDLSSRPPTERKSSLKSQLDEKREVFQ